jgi:hypothetical protein
MNLMFEFPNNLYVGILIPCRIGFGDGADGWPGEWD